MKQPNFKKLYPQLMPDELAKLALTYLCKQDMTEAARVAAAVPRIVCTCNDLDYTRKVEGFFKMISAWEKRFWWARFKREQAYALCLSLVMNMGLDEDGKVLIRNTQALEKWEATLLAFDCALDAVCATEGLDSDDVRRLVAAERFEPLEPREGSPNTKPDADMLDTMTASLTEILSSPNTHA